MAKAPAGGYTVVGPDVAAIGGFPYIHHCRYAGER